MSKNPAYGNIKIVRRVFPWYDVEQIFNDWKIKYPIFEHESDNLTDIDFFIWQGKIYFVCKYVIDNRDM